MSIEIPRPKVSRSVKPREIYRIKIISMGDGGVGKSCLIKRYCEEKFVAKYISTIGVDYGVKKVMVSAKEVKVNFWDLAGHPEFFEVRNEFYKDTQGAILVYDVTSRRSFEALESWVRESAKFGCKDATFCVCANKTDLGARAVSEKEGRSWAQAHNCIYYETSANTGDNVKEMFNTLFATIVTRVLPK